ncbi:MAG: hypothetical protein SF053_20235 [Bacteroidia bacterium]|nr:hypothetical protein [Bacteroidia bacterium]
MSTIIAVILSITLVYQLPLPLDGIAKFIVVLAVFAAVYGVEQYITRRKQDPS